VNINFKNALTPVGVDAFVLNHGAGCCFYIFNRRYDETNKKA